MQNSIKISIADFSIKLQSKNVITLDEGYAPFVIDESGSKSDITIDCISGLPAITFREEELVFEAKNDNQKFYSIYQTDSDLNFIIYNQENIDEIQQIAILDASYSNWTVYCIPESDESIIPLKYPLGPIVMYYLTVNSASIMIHASCIFDGTKGRIFTGFSGFGKSTMSKLWADTGKLVINDDRLIIRKREDGYLVYNTPMYYNDLPKKAPLNAIHLISHSPENKIKKQSGAFAVSKVLAFCIQNNYNKKFIQSHLDFLSELCNCVPVYELGFVPDASIVNFVTANEI